MPEFCLKNAMILLLGLHMRKACNIFKTISISVLPKRSWILFINSLRLEYLLEGNAIKYWEKSNNNKTNKQMNTKTNKKPQTKQKKSKNKQKKSRKKKSECFYMSEDWLLNCICQTKNDVSFRQHSRDGLTYLCFSPLC